MGIAARYDDLIASGELEPDPAQAVLVHRFQALADALVRGRRGALPDRSLFARWRKPSTEAIAGVRGLYVYGGVGRGKTFLADLFFDSLPFQDRERHHFHRFMAGIHADLRALGEVDDPLKRIAEARAGEARLLLLDEIHVNDITDAMLLGGLLTALFARGVTLVTTSNVPPEGLYRHGLQRARFLPAIAQLKRHCEVIEIADGDDFRQRVLERSTLWLTGDEKAARAELARLFDRLSGGARNEPDVLSVNGRDFAVIARCGGLLQVDFVTLLADARSTADYLTLAERFHTVIVEGIPLLDAERDNEARRFVNLVDEFYDRGTRLIASAAAMPDELYRGKDLAFEFERAASRLTEMQRPDWQRSTRDASGHVGH